MSMDGSSESRRSGKSREGAASEPAQPRESQLGKDRVQDQSSRAPALEPGPAAEQAIPTNSPDVKESASPTPERAAEMISGTAERNGIGEHLSEKSKMRDFHLNPDVLNDRGLTLWELHVEDAAKAAWEAALAVDPLHPQASYNLAVTEWRDALITDEEAVRRMALVKERRPIAGLYLSLVHLERMACDDAERELTEALMDPHVQQDSRAWQVFGLALAGQGKVAHAERAYARAVQLSQGRPEWAEFLLETVGEVAEPATSPSTWIRVLERLPGLDWQGRALAITPDGELVLSGSFSGEVRLWNVRSRTCLCVFRAHGDPAEAVAITLDGKRGASGDIMGEVRLWRLPSGGCLQICRQVSSSGSVKQVTAIAMTPGARFALSGTHDGRLRLWDLRTGGCTLDLQGPRETLEAVSLTPNARLALAGSEHGDLRLWDLSSGTCVRTFGVQTRRLMAAAMTPDARHAISGDWDGCVRIWEVATRRCLRTIRVDAPVAAIALAADGRSAAAATADSGPRVIRLELDALGWGGPPTRLARSVPAAGLSGLPGD
jgi:hypothetical protein